ncbi:MAG: sigma-70 family RNA polymerase sigma factor [Bryobacteraceae bacterium]
MTDLLQRASQGDKEAESDLLSRVYAELHCIAARYFSHERQGHTLQPTALVHEVYIRLMADPGIEWKNRGHFFSIAARVMRRLLVDHARTKRAEKRGGGDGKVPLDEELHIAAAEYESFPELDAALDRLEALRPRWAKVVELRYFAGMTEVEIAAALDISEKTVKRDWQRARAWLYDELSR